jgi:hypothetical protein
VVRDGRGYSSRTFHHKRIDELKFPTINYQLGQATTKQHILLSRDTANILLYMAHDIIDFIRVCQKLKVDGPVQRQPGQRSKRTLKRVHDPLADGFG